MADPARRRPENAPGPWFVDDTCIDCGTCMWMAPDVFSEAGGMSAVHAQPPERDPDASAALVACPTGSIGGPAGPTSFPRPIADGVWHCGYHDRRSFGAASYLTKTAAGNVLVDVPRFSRPLVRAVEAMGGVQAIVLTHRDDVASHQEWRDHFGAHRIIHADDDRIGAEVALEGADGTAAGLDWMHVPGHTRGSVVYRHGGVVFTGDHLAAHDDGTGLVAFRRACWYDWGEQRRSMARMADWDVRHVLPGHGAPWHGEPETYRGAMRDLLAWMERAA